MTGSELIYFYRRKRSNITLNDVIISAKYDDMVYSEFIIKFSKIDGVSLINFGYYDSNSLSHS